MVHSWGLGVSGARPSTEYLSMGPTSEQPAMVMLGVEPRDEHDLRVWTPIAMWLAGAGAIGVGTVLPGGGTLRVAELRGLVGVGLCLAVVTFLVFRPASNRALYVLTNIFSTLGAVTVWLACLWSGGPNSGFAELYFFPVLYDAYFFRPKHVVWHLVLNSGLALSPLFYASSLQGGQFPGHVAMLISGFWGMSAVVAYRKRRLLRAELMSRRQALSDPLTDVHNLRGLRERAEQQPLTDGTAVLVIDVDDFKALNTEYGHTGADGLLRQVALDLVSLTDDRDCVARIGGDEFAILISGRTAPEVLALGDRCAHVIKQTRGRAGLQGRDLSISVGCALWPEDGRTLPELLDAADREMLDTKSAKRVARRGGREPLPSVEPQAPHVVLTGGSSAVAGPRPRLVTEPARGIRQENRAREAVWGWWRSRSSRTVAAAAAWVTASVSTLVVISLPDADRAHLSQVAALIVCAAAVGALVFFLAPAAGEAAYVVSDALAVPAIGLAVYLTGGSTSPLLPLVFLAVTLAAYFATRRGAIYRLAGGVAVCASPLAYTGGDARLLFVLRFVALATTAAVLVAIILFNKRELAQAEQASIELASRDPLTGLPNRRAFHMSVTGALEPARGQTASPLSIAMIDLDNFKRINDTHGHAAGDAALQAIASALRRVTRPGDCVARIGGDEFALLAHDVDMSASRALSARCVEAVEEAVTRAGYADCAVSATVGYALYPHHGKALDSLLEAADRALMHAKDMGKRRIGCAAPRATSA
jgi:diguanylate cyclase (GGDEF)-like protein